MRESFHCDLLKCADLLDNKSFFYVRLSRTRECHPQTRAALLWLKMTLMQMPAVQPAAHPAIQSAAQSDPSFVHLSTSGHVTSRLIFIYLEDTDFLTFLHCPIYRKYIWGVQRVVLSRMNIVVWTGGRFQAVCQMC